METKKDLGFTLKPHVSMKQRLFWLLNKIKSFFGYPAYIIRKVHIIDNKLDTLKSIDSNLSTMKSNVIEIENKMNRLRSIEADILKIAKDFNDRAYKDLESFYKTHDLLNRLAQLESKVMELSTPMFVSDSQNPQGMFYKNDRMI